MTIKYDTIGTGYNASRRADPYLIERIIHHLQPRTGGAYLDLGCGTGNYTIALAERGFSFTGVDPSRKMLTVARTRNRDIAWLKSTAADIPKEDRSFDGVIAFLTIHHWPDLKAAFLQINKVLSESGRVVLFTSTPEQMENYWLNDYFPEMLRASVAQMPSLSDMQVALRFAELEIESTEKYFVRDDLQDYFLYSGKNTPERYFDATIRRGISSFADLSNTDEVKAGLARLRNDIENKTFDSIKNMYTKDTGDYLFVTIRKKLS